MPGRTHGQEPEPERTTVALFRASTGRTDVIAVAERLETYPEWAAVMLFLIGDGDTRLFAHLVVPGPENWTPFGPRQKWLTEVARPFSQHPPEGRQLTTRIIRSVRSGDLERFARGWARTMEGHVGIAVGSTGDEDHKTRSSASAKDRRLAQFAARFVELCESSATPRKDIGAELHLADNTVGRRLFDARERGLLTSPGQGRTGGALTERARRILEEGSD